MCTEILYRMEFLTNGCLNESSRWAAASRSCFLHHSYLSILLKASLLLINAFLLWKGVCSSSLQVAQPAMCICGCKDFFGVMMVHALRICCGGGGEIYRFSQIWAHKGWHVGSLLYYLALGNIVSAQLNGIVYACSFAASTNKSGQLCLFSHLCCMNKFQ